MRIRNLAAPLVLLCALLYPTPGETIPLYVSAGSDLPVTFGLVPFEVDDKLHDFQDSFSELHDSFWLESGWAHLQSGPLVDLEQFSNGFDYTRYSYGPGILELSLTVRDGDTVTGTFSAPTKGFSIVVCEGCDGMSGNGAADDFEISLGEGTFDPALAAFLHIERETFGGYINFGLEDIDGGPLDERRGGFDHRGLALMDIYVSTVPEPSLLLMLAAGVAAISARRGISRARTSGPR